MPVAVLGIALEISGEGAVKQRESLGEAALVTAKWRLQGKDVEPISEGISCGLIPCLPPRIGHGEGFVRSPNVSIHPASISEVSPGEGAKLVDPARFERRALFERVGDQHRELRQLGRPGRIVRGDLPALPAEQLAKTPTREAPSGAGQTQAALVGMAREDLPETWRLGPGAGEGDIHRSEQRRQGTGPVEIEEIAAGFAAFRADGDQVKQAAVFVFGAVLGQEALQGGPVQVVVLHARFSVSRLYREVT